jgi:uncharacterized protein
VSITGLGINAYFDRSYERSYHAQLMSERLPRDIDPLRLADEGVRLEGEIPGELFPRLLEWSVADTPPDDVRIAVEFERTSHGVRLLRGNIGTRLTVTCQRCLSPMQLELEAHPFLVLLAPGDQPSGGPEEAEALVVEGPIRLSEWVEDELILAMPMIPVHDDEKCSSPRTGPLPESDTEGKQNPFATLGGFKPKN